MQQFKLWKILKLSADNMVELSQSLELRPYDSNCISIVFLILYHLVSNPKSQVISKTGVYSTVKQSFKVHKHRVVQVFLLNAFVVFETLNLIVCNVVSFSYIKLGGSSYIPVRISLLRWSTTIVLVQKVCVLMSLIIIQCLPGFKQPAYVKICPSPSS